MNHSVSSKSPEGITQVAACGLAAIVWFGIFNQAAHDLWAASVVFGTLTALALFLLIALSWRNEPLRLPFWPSLLLISAAIWASVPRSFDAFTSRQDAWGWGFVVIAFLIAANNLRDARGRDRFMLWSCLGLLPLAVLAHTKGHEGAFRVIVNPLVLVGFTLFWPFWILEQLRRQRWIALFLIAWALIFVAAGSASGYLAFGIGLIYYYRHGLRRWAKKHQGLAAGACLAATLLVTVTAYARLRVSAPGYSGVARLYFWASAWQAWRAHLMTGVGIGAFPIAYEWFRPATALHSQFAHSFPLQIAAETGTLGLIAFSFLARQAAAQWRRDNGPREDLGAFKAGIVAVVVFSLVNFNLEYLLNKFILAVFLGMIAGPHAKSYHISRLRLAVVAVALFFSIPFWAGLFVSGRLTVAGTDALIRGRLDEGDRLLQDATSVEPANGMAWAARSSSAALRFASSHDPHYRAEALMDAAEAFRRLKDPRLLERIKAYQRKNPA